MMNNIKNFYGLCAASALCFTLLFPHTGLAPRNIEQEIQAWYGMTTADRNEFKDLLQVDQQEGEVVLQKYRQQINRKSPRMSEAISSIPEAIFETPLLIDGKAATSIAEEERYTPPHPRNDLFRIFRKIEKERNRLVGPQNFYKSAEKEEQNPLYTLPGALNHIYEMLFIRDEDVPFTSKINIIREKIGTYKDSDWSEIYNPLGDEVYPITTLLQITQLELGLPYSREDFSRTTNIEDKIKNCRQHIGNMKTLTDLSNKLSNTDEKRVSLEEEIYHAVTNLHVALKEGLLNGANLVHTKPKTLRQIIENVIPYISN